MKNWLTRKKRKIIWAYNVKVRSKLVEMWTRKKRKIIRTYNAKVRPKLVEMGILKVRIYKNGKRIQ